MIVRNYLIDSYFFLGLVLFTLGRVFDSFFIQIYILVNFIGLILILLQFLNLNLKLRISSIGAVVLSFLFYLIGNLFFISDINLGLINLSDIFFIFQIVLKQVFIFSSQGFKSNSKIIQQILLINGLVILLSLYLSNISSGNFLDYYYFNESFLSMIFLIFVNLIEPKFFINFSYVDLDFFFFGQLFWLVGDMIYSTIHYINYSPIGDPSDIFFFIGFYFFIRSLNRIKGVINFNIVKI